MKTVKFFITAGLLIAAYRGSHTISMSEFESLVNYNGWISVFTNVSEGSYIYE